MKLNFCLTVAISLTLVGLQAQESTITSGGEASGDGGTVSYTLGQVAFSTHTGTTGSVTEGVQQPYEISVVIGVDNIGIDLKISAYPNPVTDHLILTIADDTYVGNIRWIASLYDLKGSILKKQIIVSDETTIDMADLQPATYFLKVISENEEVKTFKIIKNQ
jgi:hypothetical protein